MFGRILMTLGLAMLLAAPAHAGFGLVLPDSPIVDDPEKTSLNLVICAIDPATGAGIVISASHNPYEHNGIKVFSGQGYKLSDSVEARIEEKILSQEPMKLRTRGEIGRRHHGMRQLKRDYIDFVASTIESDLAGLKILADCANGAASATAPELFGRFKARTDFIHRDPDGVNINSHCGSTHLEDLAAAVRAARETAREGDVVVLSPACAAGHSLGEYSALAAAGALSPESTLELVSLRGKLMADADPDGKGGMAAILKLNREAVNEIAKAAAEATGEILIVANHNTPTQFVISGTKAAVEAALPLVKEKKGRAVPLPVSGAFHSPLMDTAAQELAKALNKMTWSRPRFPVYSNVTGKAVTDGESLHELATVQMISSVLWIDTIANQWHDGIRSWVEVGPKGTLSRMVKPILDAVPVEEEVTITAVGSLGGVNAFA